MTPEGPRARSCSRGARRARALLGTAVLAGLAVACSEPRVSGEGGAGPATAPSADSRPAHAAALAPARRLIEPASPQGFTAGIPRVQIGSETRPVLGAAARRVLRWRDPVAELGPSLSVPVEVPVELAAGASAVRVDVSVSVQPEAFRGKEPLEARATSAGRQRLSAAPLVVAADRLAAVPELAVEIEVPQRMWGLGGLVDVVARPLPAAAVDVWEGGPFPVSAEDRLVFGYGVEREGYSRGWPPVHFRVLARTAEGEERLLFDRRLDPAADPRDRGWFDAELPLADVASEAVTLRFEAEPVVLPGSAAARSFPVVSAPEILPGRGDEAARDPRSPWNVILVSLDTLRARSVGAYGHVRDTTPSIDRRIAGEGAMLRETVVPVPYTPPAHMSMLTGLEPCAHRVEDRHGVLPEDRLTLAEILRAAGYRTAAFTENGYVVAGAGFARGFDRYFEQLSEESASPGFAPEIFRAAEEWLDHAGTRPFFLFLHTYQVHDPYVPPRGYLELFDDEVTAGYSAENRANLDAYEREIRYTDDLLAGFLDYLEAHGLDGRTLLVVTSDHGEAFGEHFWTGHGLDVHDEAILVPLLLRAPGLVPRGLVIEQPMGLIDLVPTLLGLLGLETPAGLQGRSFAALLRGESDAIEDRPIVSTATNGASVRTARYKLLRAHEKDWRFLYDVQADPGERVDLFRQRPDEAAALEAIYQDWKARCNTLAAEAESGARRAGDRQPGWLINRDEIDEKLRSLGYIE